MQERPIVPPGMGIPDIGELVKRITPIFKGRVFMRYVAADTDILLSAVAPVFPASMLRVTVALRVATILSAVYTRENIIQRMNFNSGDPLVANSLYAFDLPVTRDDTVNFQTADATMVLLLSVMEIGA